MTNDTTNDLVQITVMIGGNYYTRYRAAHWMDERWKRYIEKRIHFDARFVRWGIETHDGQITWQLVILAMLLGPLLVLLT